MAVTTDVPCCPACGASYALVGHVHRCSGGLRDVAPVAMSPLPNEAPPLPNRPQALTNNATPNSLRQARWREKNRDRYNEYQRELMRSRRA